MADGDRSQSVSSDFTSLVPSTNSQGKTKRRRGKGRKSLTDGINLAQNPRSGRDRTTEEARRSQSQAHDLEDEDDDEDELAQLQAAADVDDGTTLNDATAEKQKLSVLTAAFDQEQEERYSMFRRCKLKPEKVRKITNAIVSQSVPQAVVTAVNGIGKVFVGRLVERAREVRAEWESMKNAPASLQSECSKVKIGSTDVEHNKSDNQDAVTKIGSSSYMELRVTERDAGPLQADHLREALRRLKRHGEMGGSGLGGSSVGLGIAGTASVRREGRRLFK